MDDLDWLAERRFKEAIRYEYSWDFVFDGEVAVTSECLWRLLENGRIRLTSKDDGQKFGLPEAVDAALKVNQILAGARTNSVTLHDGTLDLEIRFDTGHILQIIPESSGYEAWSAREPSRQFIAVGGGELYIFSAGGSG